VCCQLMDDLYRNMSVKAHPIHHSIERHRHKEHNTSDIIHGSQQERQQEGRWD